MKKILRTKGFTLAEVLIATAILAVFASMAIFGTSALLGSDLKMMSVSKAAVLGSDALKVIANEIRFGKDFELLSDGTIKYGSTAYGDNCTIKLDDDKGQHKGQLTIVQTPRGSTSDDGSKTFRPIGSAAYDEVWISSVVFDIKKSEKDTDRQIISCTLSVTDGTNTLWQETLTVVPLYQKTSYK